MPYKVYTENPKVKRRFMANLGSGAKLHSPNRGREKIEKKGLGELRACERIRFEEVTTDLLALHSSWALKSNMLFPLKLLG
jgi:hypothetical protein